MERISIYGPARLGDHQHLYAFARAAMRVVQESGLVPKDRSALSRNALAVWIEDNGTAAIAVFFEVEPANIWLDFLYVEPHRRRKGYAAALLKRIAAIAADNGIAKVMLGTHEQNEPMRRLGQACGYLTSHVVLSRPIARPQNGAGLA